jgi:RNA polymerase sigma factor (sigma-70 family)
MTKRVESNWDTGGLLRRLRGVDAGPAWVEFLDRYAQLIMNTAGQIEFEQDRVHECFLFVCEKLSENGFRRLLSFNTSGKARFGTWLTTVTFSLCVDWHRREYGRVRLLPAIAALPEFDQSVYRLVIEQGMAREAAFQNLRMDFPDLTRQSVTNSLRRIHGLLTPRQRWQINVQRGRVRGRGPTTEHIDLLPDATADPAADSELRAQREAIEASLSRLPQDQRLLLYWRYQEGLSLAKIAELADLGNTNLTWRRIQAAVDALFALVHETGLTEDQKN